MLRFHGIAGPDAGAKTEGGIIGEGQGIGGVAGAEDRCDRAERFFERRRGGARHVEQDRGRIIEARAFERGAADRDACARRHGTADLIREFIPDLRRGERADIRLGVHRVTDAERTDLRNELGFDR